MKYSLLRKYLWISLFITGAALLCNCKGAANNNESREPEAVTKSDADAGLSDSTEAEAIDQKKEGMVIPAKDSLKQPPQHNAPNQSEIDSLKKVKTNTKKKQ